MRLSQILHYKYVLNTQKTTCLIHTLLHILFAKITVAIESQVYIPHIFLFVNLLFIIVKHIYILFIFIRFKVKNH